MKAKLILSNIFNLIDVITTIIGLNIGFIEFNPIMRILTQSPILFALIKLGVVALLSVYIYFRKKDKLSSLTALIMCIFFIFVALWNIAMLLHFA